MLYRVAEDERGNVTVSEMDAQSRRVLRSVRLEQSAGEMLLTVLAQSVPASGRVRKYRTGTGTGEGLVRGRLFGTD